MPYRQRSLGGGVRVSWVIVLVDVMSFMLRSRFLHMHASYVCNSPFIRELLSDKDHLLPPTEHVEKGESERSEKYSRLVPKSLSAQVWEKVMDLILPILHPAQFLHVSFPGPGNMGGGEDSWAKVRGAKVFRFHHSAIQTAVGRIFFNAEKDDVFDGKMV